MCGIAEVKDNKQFNSKSVCQTIGYHIASRAGLHSIDGPQPPLAILFCENRLRFIFFPFCKDGTPCVDVIETFLFHYIDVTPTTLFPSNYIQG